MTPDEPRQGAAASPLAAVLPAPPPVAGAVSPRFNTIQVLRFIAAALVLVGHTFLFVNQRVPLPMEITYLLRGGGWGVMLFFAISGFVLTHTAQRLAAGEFLVHRLLRIFPPFWIAFILVYAAYLIALGGPMSDHHWSLKALTLLPFGAIGYPLWVEWSLVYEVFFYAVFALLWIPRSVELPTLAQIPVSTRNLPFIGGIGAYFVFARVGPATRNLLLPIALAAALLMPIMPSTDLTMVFGTISAVAVLLLAATRALVRDARDTSPWVQFGDYSYGLYLMHVSVIILAVAVGHVRNANPVYLLAMSGTLALAIGLLYGRAESELYRRLRRAVARRFAARRAVAAAPRSS